MCRETLYSDTMTKELSDALPNYMPVARFQRIAMSAINNTPKLLENDRKSLWSAIMTAAQSGLYLDGFIGEAHLVPGKKNVTFQPGYKGLIKLARNSGEVCNITAHVVHEGDKFKYIQGDEERIVHEADVFGERGDLVGVYAIATMKDGSKQRAVMSANDVADIKKSSYGSKESYSPWVKYTDEMWKKTAVKRLCKLLPSSTDDLDRVVAVSNQNDIGNTANLSGDMIEVEKEEVEQTGESERLAGIVREEGVGEPL